MTSGRTAHVAFALGAGLVLAVGSATPAIAAEANSWASLSVSASPSPFTGTVTLPGGFPTTSFASNSSSATTPSGASTWLAAGTGVGQIYGSSLGSPYLNLRPAAGGTASPSTTTYIFAHATPAAGWSFVLGDIDADSVTIAATGVGGTPVEASALGFQSVFNYCHQTSGPSCDADNDNDVPVFTDNGATATVLGNVDDTDGAAAWFSPSVPLTSLVFTFAAQSGSPTFQTWFVDKTRSVDGIATLDDEPLAAVAVEIRDRNDVTVAETVTDNEGEWTVPELVADADYTVVIDTPDGAEAPDAPVAFDLTTADATGVATAFVAVAADPDDDDEPSTAVPGEADAADDELAATGVDAPAVAIAIAFSVLTAGFVLLAVRRRRSV